MRVKSSIRDACDQRLPPTLPILAPTLRTVIERVEVSPALSMHHAFSRRATRFRGSTRFTLRRFLPKVKRCFPPRSIDRARSIEPTSERPRRLAFEHATPCGMHVSPVRPRSLPSPIRENERFSRPETPFIDRSNPLLLREAPVRGLLLKEVLGPRNADLFRGRSAGIEVGPGISFGDSVESHHRKEAHPFGANFSGRRRSRDFATATRRPTSHRPARSPASGLARPTFPDRSRRIVVRNVVDRLLQHDSRCVGTSIRVHRYLARVSGVSQDTLLRAVSGLFRSCEQCTYFVAEDCDWPRFTESRLLSHWERQSPHSTSLEHPVVTLSRVRCFGEARRVSKRSRPIRRRRSAKNYRLETQRRQADGGS